MDGIRSMLPACLPLLTAAVLLGVALTKQFWHRDKLQQRVGELAAWARSQGWSYQQTDPGLVTRFEGPPFGVGRSRKVYHVLSGPYRGHQVLAFQYQFVVSTGRSSTAFDLTVVSIAIPAPRPNLLVGPEHRGHRLLDLVGIRDVQFESDEFNRTFLVKAEDEKFAYDVLHPRMMEWLLADQRSRTTPFRFEGATLLCWRNGELEPRVVFELADFLLEIMARVPSYVWR